MNRWEQSPCLGFGGNGLRADVFCQHPPPRSSQNRTSQSTNVACETTCSVQAPVSILV